MPTLKSYSDVFDLYENLEHNQIMLCFKGEVTSDLLTALLEVVESKLERFNEQPRVKKRVFNILVECLQNLYHHGQENNSSNQGKLYKSGVMVMIAKKQDGYSIITGNYINNEAVEHLKDRLERINTMSREDIKELYKTVLINGRMSEKGGGGLGIIDIARKSGEKLDYGFIPLEDDATFFSLNVQITDNTTLN